MNQPLLVDIRARRDARRFSATTFDSGAGLTSVQMSTWRTTLSLVVRKPVDPAGLRRMLEDEVGRLDRAASRFRADSELSLANRTPGEWVRVSEYLHSVLSSAVVAAELTGGLVHPGVGNLVDAAGYRAWRDGSAIPDQPAANRSRVELRSDGHVRVPVGMQLDVGAVAKAWLADRLALMAAEHYACGALANMGGDICAAGDQPWVVAADPQVEGVDAQVLEICEAGLTTSSVGQRRWTNPDGTPAHHIIDPRTGFSADTMWISCSVIAATAAQANAASTASLILSEDGPGWLTGQGLDGWFVAPDKQSFVGRWPQ